jgi:DNA polymerase-1
MEKVLIIDAMGLIFRAYYALIKRPLSTSKGFPTSAIFGFWKMLFRCLKDLEPDRLVIAFDSKGPSFRKEIYDAYKANRETPPEDLQEQIKYIVNMVEEVKLPNLSKSGLEADDIIAFLSKKFQREGDEVYILSSDKDLAQLVDDRIKMAYPEKGIQDLRIIDRDGVQEKFGVPPEKIMDYLALVGDSSDNIPGVKGVGPKTAQKLLEQYSGLDDIYNHIEEISGSVQKKLKENKESAYLSLKLTHLKEDLDLEFNPDDYDYTDEPFLKLREQFKELEFSSLIEDEFFKDKVPEAEYNDPESLFSHAEPVKNALSEDNDYRLILTSDELQDLKERILKQGRVSVDTETTSENPLEAQIIGCSFALKPHEAFYVPLYDENPAEFSKEEFFECMKEVFESENIGKIGQNIKYDYQVLSPYVKLRGIGFDTMIGAYLLEPDAKKYNMDHLAWEYLDGYKTIEYKEIVPKNGTLLDLPLEEVKDYACEDADITLRLYEKLSEKMKLADLNDIYEKIENPVISILAEMELAGIKLDLDRLKIMQVEMEDKLAEIEEKIFDIAGVRFNLNSPKQIGEILFEKMGLPVVRKTKTGYSTDEKVLEQLKDYEIAGHILDYRKYSKLLTTYVQALPRYLRKGRVHTSFLQTGTATGRLASKEPNLQNIPIRDEVGKGIRAAFVAEKGYSLVSADYSQIELRLMAHLSEDGNMIEAFRRDKDVHRFTASLVFDIPEPDVTDFQRHLAKSINFGIIYGMGAYKFSREVGISMSEAKSFIDRYFQRFNRVKTYIEEIKEEGRMRGYVRTLFGHRRFLPYIRSRNRNLREADERMAVNTLIQGTNAGLLKKAMIDIFPELGQYESRMLLQIHDELIFEVKEDRVISFIELLRDKMENVLKLKVPLKISVSSGKNWGELK